jgi:hypothetical protein
MSMDKKIIESTAEWEFITRKKRPGRGRRVARRCLKSVSPYEDILFNETGTLHDERKTP